MQKKIIEFTYYWADKLGVEVKKITFRKYGRALGRAFSERKEIRYNKNISQLLTRKEQNYLALHEVAHLATPRVHSKKWKAVMDMYCPGWRKYREKLGKRRKRQKTAFRIKTEIRLRKMKKDSIKRLLRNSKTSTHVKHIAKEILKKKI